MCRCLTKDAVNVNLMFELEEMSQNHQSKSLIICNDGMMVDREKEGGEERNSPADDDMMR